MSTDNDSPVKGIADAIERHAKALRGLQMERKREHAELVKKAEEEDVADDRIDVLDDLLHYLEEAIEQLAAAHDSLVYAAKAHDSLTPKAGT